MWGCVHQPAGKQHGVDSTTWVDGSGRFGSFHQACGPWQRFEGRAVERCRVAWQGTVHAGAQHTGRHGGGGGLWSAENGLFGTVKRMHSRHSARFRSAGGRRHLRPHLTLDSTNTLTKTRRRGVAGRNATSRGVRLAVAWGCGVRSVGGRVPSGRVALAFVWGGRRAPWGGGRGDMKEGQRHLSRFPNHPNHGDTPHAS